MILISPSGQGCGGGLANMDVSAAQHHDTYKHNISTTSRASDPLNTNDHHWDQ